MRISLRSLLPSLSVLALLSANPALSDALFSNPTGLGKSLVDKADSEQPFLEVDDAFQLSNEPLPSGLKINWEIAPGYYLYKHSMRVSQGDLRTIQIEASPALRKSDPYFGQVEIYYHGASLNLIFPAQGPIAEGAAIQVEYQGCADDGLCYPTQTRTVVYEKSR